MYNKKIFTSESVTEGHPDKVCDQISDGILDAIIKNDPNARVACEVCVTTGLIMVIGEISTNTYVDIPKVARSVVRDIGYTGNKWGFDADSCSVITSIDEQSPDIAMGVDASVEQKNQSMDKQCGAGDQGLMFGFACDETPELMPLPISLSHALAKRLAEVRKNGTLPYLGPDGKTQVTIEYIDDRPSRVDTIVISNQHAEDVSIEQIRKDLFKHVIVPVADKYKLDDKTKIHINPTGRFVIGGPQGDSGLTGRKIIVDTYGGYARHGGGAFSGKDPTKVDRSASYAARYVAKNIVAAKLARKCEVQIAYAIGVAQPVSVMVDTFGTNTVDESVIEALVKKYFDLRPTNLIEMFDLRKPIYTKLAAYGHIGREELDLKFEKTDMAEILAKEAFGK